MVGTSTVLSEKKTSRGRSEASADENVIWSALPFAFSCGTWIVAAMIGLITALTLLLATVAALGVLNTVVLNTELLTDPWVLGTAWERRP